MHRSWFLVKYWRVSVVKADLQRRSAPDKGNHSEITVAQVQQDENFSDGRQRLESDWTFYQYGAYARDQLTTGFL